MSPHRPDSIYTIAPRLALAMDQRRAELAAARSELKVARYRREQLDRLIIHRELQLLRAGSTGDRRDIKRRADKLQKAKLDQARIQARITRLEAEAA